MKILQITNRIPFPLNDGGNIATWNLTNNLHQLGNEVVLASLNTRKHYQNPAVLKNIAEVHAVEIDTTISLLGLARNLLSPYPYNISRFVSEQFAVLLTDLLRSRKFDIVQLEGIYLAVYLDVIRKNTDAVVVLRAHNAEHLIWQRLARKEKNILRRVFFERMYRGIRRFEKKHLTLFDAVVTLTSDEETLFRQWGFTGAITTIPAGTDTNIFYPGKEEAVPSSIAILGSLEWLPNLQGIDWFLENAWLKILQKYPQAKLRIAGKNPGILNWSSKYQNVEVLGMVEDAASFLRSNEIMIIPLLSGGGMRLKLLEAMASGLPVVSTTTGAEGVPVRDGQEILLADDPEKFADSVLQLLKDADLRNRIAGAAINFVTAKYNWTKLTQEMINFYRSLSR